MRLQTAFILLLLASIFAYADPMPPVLPENSVSYDFIAYESSQGAPISNAVILLKSSSGDFLAVTDEAGAFSASLPSAISTVDIGADYDSTPGYDLMASNIRLSNASAQRVSFIPAGTISGSIRDANGVPVPGALVSIACQGYSESTSSDSAGIFGFDFAPAGDCEVSSQPVGRTAAIRVIQGQISSIELTPPIPAPPAATPAPQQSSTWLVIGALFAGIIVAVIIIIGLVLAAFWLLRNSMGQMEETAAKEVEELPFVPAEKPRPAARAHAAPAATEPTPGQLDIMQTLSKREYDITSLLIKSGGRMRASKIRYSLLIPKTSFFRILNSLQAKMIIEKEKYENSPEIRLTSWFMSK